MADEQPRPVIRLEPGERWSGYPKGTLLTGVNGTSTVWRVVSATNLRKVRG